MKKGPAIAGPLELARPAGFEPTTPWFVAKYSIQLSYGREGRDYTGSALEAPVIQAFRQRLTVGERGEL